MPRSSFRRGARLASLPLGFAGRATLGLGRRTRRHPGRAGQRDLQQRAAEQLFRVLGELKGGAMKFGQALSLFESVLPEDMAAPYREQLTRLQDAAPPMPPRGCTPCWPASSARTGGSSSSSFDAAAGGGRLDRSGAPGGLARRAYGRGEGAVPGADEALRSDLRQIGRLSRVVAPLAGGWTSAAGRRS